MWMCHQAASDIANGLVPRLRGRAIAYRRDTILRSVTVQCSCYYSITNMTKLPIAKKTCKSTYERIRTLSSKIIGAMILLLLLFSKPDVSSSVWREINELTGFTLLIIAGLGRIWCTIYIVGRKDHLLCTSGPYSLCRNPLYFFSFVGLTGFMLSSNHVCAAAVVVPVFLVSYHFIIKHEETRLLSLFGREYEDYCLKTGRFFPNILGNRTSTREQTVNIFSFEKNLRDISGFFFCIIFLEIIEVVQNLPGWLLLF